jgi:hypothetical protein
MQELSAKQRKNVFYGSGLFSGIMISSAPIVILV